MSDESTKEEPVHVVGAEELTALATDVMTWVGCEPDIAAEIAEHLVGADLCGVPSHGTMRLTQYAKQAQTGYLNPEGRPSGVRYQTRGDRQRDEGA